VSPVSGHSETGSVVGVKLKPSLCIPDVTKQSHSEPIRLNFRFKNNNIYSNTLHPDYGWDALLWKGNMYLQIPSGIQVERSKEAFISLLEFGEDDLNCNNIVVGFSKSRAERNTLMRIFMFLGFVALPPNDPLAPTDASADSLYMAYNMA